jgi:hypothetical protein
MEDPDNCEALGPDPEWDQLVAWAGIAGAAEPVVDAATSPAPAADAPAAAEIEEDWEAVIARAKAATPAPVAIDELSSRRTRNDTASRPVPATLPMQPAMQPADEPAPDLGEDAWQIALRRAKQR